jgi:hypothetical protein
MQPQKQIQILMKFSKKQKKGCYYVCDLTNFVSFNVIGIMQYNFLCKHLEKILSVFGGYLISMHTHSCLKEGGYYAYL